MDHGIAPAKARPLARAVTTMTATSMVAALATSFAFAQQPAPGAKPPAATPAKPAAGTPAKPAAGAAKPQQAQQGAAAMPQLIYSQWTKFCVTPGEANANAKEAAAKEGAAKEGAAKDSAAKEAAAKDAAGKQICLTGIDGRMESGMPIVAVVAIEPTKSDAKKILRLTLPVGMHLQHGTRFIIDQGQPMTAPYVACFANGCISDYDLNTETLGKLKKGQTAVVQGINYNGSAISVPVPLGEFAKAHDGPPTDPKVLEARQKKLEEELKRKGEELQKKANEARQQLEQGQAQQPPKPQ